MLHLNMMMERFPQDPHLNRLVNKEVIECGWAPVRGVVRSVVRSGK